MKLPLVAFTALVAFATVDCHFFPAFGEGPLYEDIQYFLDMIPMQKVIEVVVEYASEDAGFQAYLKYLQSDEIKQMLQEIQHIPEFRDFISYLQNRGVHMYDIMNKLNKQIGIPPYQPALFGVNSEQKISGGVSGLFNDIKALISYDVFIKGYAEKMRHSVAFREFVEYLKSPNHQKFVNALYANQRFLHFRQTIVQEGIDVILIEDIIYTVLGVQFPEFKQFAAYPLYQNELSKDIHEFIALLNMDKIMGIVAAHMQDDQVKKALTYLQSEEFHVLVRNVEAMKEYQDLVLYLHDAGLDIFNLIQKIHKFFGMEDYVPPHHGKYQSLVARANLGGIKGLVDEIIATLPKDKIKALYEYKMKNSPAFKKFVDKLRSPDFKKIVDLVYHTPIFLEMRQKAIEAGLDLAPIRELIKKVLGLDLHVPVLYTYAQNELSKDIHEFIALLNMDKIMGIVAAHMQDDQVKKALTYLQSEEFHVLVRNVEAMKEYQDLVLYLHDAGLDIFNLIQKVHKFFGMEDYVPPHHGQFETYNVRVNLGGIKGLVDEIIATLPKDKIKALYEYKMKNSPAFKKFVDKLRSPDFKKIVDLVYHTPIFLEMRQKAIEAGLDLAPIRELIKKVLGLDLHVPAYY